MQTLHPAAAQGFDYGAENYRRGRPDYPNEVVSWLTDDLGLGPGRDVVDLGAGTGKFTARLVLTGARVSAVEPVAGMRDKLQTALPGVAVVSGTAEELPLEPGEADAVVCAQAFHWFATRPALAEIRRVLKPGGVLGLIWNVRDHGVPWVQAFSQILDAYNTEDAPRHQNGAWQKVFPAEGFGPLAQRQVRHSGHRGSIDDVIINRGLSVSYIAALPAPVRQEVELKLRALVAQTPELAGQEEVIFPYVTRMYWCQRDM